ncbi:MAG: hypothetical protein ABSC77_04660 [Terracidiphilus sp.]|jgi:hypothetical protein
MNRAKTNRSEAEHARIETEIGHILATEEELLPSSGFVGAVMDRVRQEAAMPAPIPFPWKRAIPLLLLASGGIVWSTVELARLGVPGLDLTALGQSAQSWLKFTLPLLSAVQVRSLEQAGWVALALGSSLVSWLLSRRLAGCGGLL